MDIKKLFDDFKTYVDAMDEQAVKENIENAVKHTQNSYVLNEQINNSNDTKTICFHTVKAPNLYGKGLLL